MTDFDAARSKEAVPTCNVERCTYPPSLLSGICALHEGMAHPKEEA